MDLKYVTKSAVLFLIFNRPDTTKQVFEQIRAARPSRLYIAADGPRPNRPEEIELCMYAREVIDLVDWKCEVRVLLRKENLGCKEAISSAITWFFEQEEEGIILEDDCLPSLDFFRYCDVLLERFRLDTRIRHIAGSNLQLGKKWGTATTYLSRHTGVWGWATWRRVWKDYDKDLQHYSEPEALDWMATVFPDQFILEHWTWVFRDLKARNIDTWDYQLTLTNYFNNGLSIIPNVNLISNIGFREDATHTTNTISPYANLPLGKIDEITIPEYFLPETEADYAVWNRDLNLDERWRRHNLTRRKLKRWLKGLINR